MRIKTVGINFCVVWFAWGGVGVGIDIHTHCRMMLQFFHMIFLRIADKAPQQQMPTLYWKAIQSIFYTHEQNEMKVFWRLIFGFLFSSNMFFAKLNYRIRTSKYVSHENNNNIFIVLISSQKTAVLQEKLCPWHSANSTLNVWQLLL